ncbi:MAG: enoyl-CoA hydratase/isomerase family protein [Lentimicrobiaceae bacterium]|nr:enoyl-CoA hydratase/isomerase family protein [Lentimicrobiaceae bacterium]
MEKIAHWTTKEDIGILTLKNPPQNFIKEPDFLSTERLLELTKDVKGMLITGFGKHFSAGADLQSLKILSQNKELLLSKLTYGNELLKCIEELNIPVIAVVNGICFGAGLEIALSAHLRIVAKNSLFAFPEINHELIPGLGGIIRLLENITKNEAVQLLLKGDVIDAEKALSLHIADDLVPAATLMEHAIQRIKRMTDCRSTEVIHCIMQAINNTRKMTRDDAIAAETRMFCELAARTNQIF